MQRHAGRLLDGGTGALKRELGFLAPALGRPVADHQPLAAHPLREMIGGIEYWAREGYPVEGTNNYYTQDGYSGGSYSECSDTAHPGVGPIVASATVAAIGNGAAFARGRDFAAWLGLVPKQMSTGDRTILGRITKRGNRYLRMLFVQGARAILLRAKSWAKA